jgi:hypothetical protein
MFKKWKADELAKFDAKKQLSVDVSMKKRRQVVKISDLKLSKTLHLGSFKLIYVHFGPIWTKRIMNKMMIINVAFI